MGKTIRMSDIAKKLNISVVSVSKALAGKSGVSDEMRTKIITLARQMGYEGSRTHNESDNTGNIGVLVSDHFFADNIFIPASRFFFHIFFERRLVSKHNRPQPVHNKVYKQKVRNLKRLFHSKERGNRTYHNGCYVYHQLEFTEF